jgi:tRNA dimethylallyltransferase
MQKVICLMGPTASGKTDLALSWARTGEYEIISVDSAMVYRGMDIGTAKPDKAILQSVPHHLVDICDPSDAYSAADFCRDATHEIKAIIARGKIPLLVGGTMMYFRALQFGLAELPAADAILRQQIDNEALEKGWQALHDELGAIDPEAAARIHPNDPQRLSRALEVYRLTGKPMSELLKETASSREFEFENRALMPEDRATLHKNILKRTEKMFADGFVNEVRALYERGDLSSDLPSMRSVGYRQVWAYLAGDLLFEDLIDKISIATRQLAKRQFTWLRRWPDLQIVRPDNLH